MNVRHFYLGNYTGGGISWAQQGVEIGQMGGNRGCVRGILTDTTSLALCFDTTMNTQELLRASSDPSPLQWRTPRPNNCNICYRMPQTRQLLNRGQCPVCGG
jgi:hypothetical protein